MGDRIQKVCLLWFKHSENTHIGNPFKVAQKGLRDEEIMVLGCGVMQLAWL